MYETKSHFFIVTDLYSGGDLFSDLEDNGVFTEDDASQLMNTVFTCMNYCHKRNLVHLDMKPENVLLSGRGKDYRDVKIIDFGLAQYQPQSQKLTSLEGSSYYISPQVIQRCYSGAKSDVWSCGVICHVLLAGYAPFDGDTYSQVLKEIVVGEFNFEEEAWDDVSEEAKVRGSYIRKSPILCGQLLTLYFLLCNLSNTLQDFISYCLTYEEDKLPSAQQALMHPFLVSLET